MELNTHLSETLENDRVRLEPLSWNHFDVLLPFAIKYPTLLQYSPSRFGSEVALKEYFEYVLGLKEKGTMYPFAIFDKSKNEFAGSTSFLNISNKNQRLEIGATWLGKEFQRTGLNRNCKFLLLKHAFEILDCQRVELKTDQRNKQSKTAILAIGAKYEGCLRSHTLMVDGYRRDTLYFSILKDEWAKIKSSIFKNY